MIRRPRRSPLFPYTTLFRSAARHPDGVDVPVDPFDLEPFAAREPAAPMELPLRSGGRDGASQQREGGEGDGAHGDRKSTRLNSSHSQISYAVFCLKKKNDWYRPTVLLGLLAGSTCDRTAVPWLHASLATSERTYPRPDHPHDTIHQLQASVVAPP